jgi:hypothetical protein
MLATPKIRKRSFALTSCKRILQERSTQLESIDFQFFLFLPIPPTRGIYLGFGDGTAPDQLQIAAIATGADPMSYTDPNLSRIAAS